MDNFPLPKLRAHWTAALLIAVFLFLIYYLFVFDSLLMLYRSQFDRVDFARSQNRLKIWAFVPRYYNSSELAWVYVHVENESDDPIYDASVYLILNSPSDKSILLLPNLYNEEVYATEAKFNVIAPHSVAIARVSFVSQAEPLVSKVLVVTVNNGTREELGRLNPKAFVRVNRSSWRALQHSFLETVLLPPWSNGFILGLVLFSTHLSSFGKKQDDEPEMFSGRGFNLHPEWRALVEQAIWDSGKVLAVMILLTILFLFLDEATFPPLAGIAALVWLINVGYPGRLWKPLARVGMLVAGLGLLWLLWGTVRNIWNISVIAAFLLIGVMSRRNLKYLKRLELWGFILTALGGTWIWLSFGQEGSTLAWILWVSMTLIGFGIFSWQMTLTYYRGILRESGSGDAELKDRDRTSNISEQN